MPSCLAHRTLSPFFLLSSVPHITDVQNMAVSERVRAPKALKPVSSASKRSSCNE